jgi:cell division GTPase FtsZ
LDYVIAYPILDPKINHAVSRMATLWGLDPDPREWRQEIGVVVSLTTVSKKEKEEEIETFELQVKKAQEMKEYRRGAGRENRHPKDRRKDHI